MVLVIPRRRKSGNAVLQAKPLRYRCALAWGADPFFLPQEASTDCVSGNTLFQKGKSPISPLDVVSTSSISPTASIHVLAAIDRHGRAGDEAGVLAGQE